MARVDRFQIDLVPRFSWGKSLSQLARTKGSGFSARWTEIRKRELARAGNRCEICDAPGDRLQCNERWMYDEGRLIQRLTGYEIVCDRCHLILHFGRTQLIGREEEAIAHFVEVTGLSKDDLALAVDEAAADWKRRSAERWRIDIGLEPLAVGFEARVNDLGSG